MDEGLVLFCFNWVCDYLKVDFLFFIVKERVFSWMKWLEILDIEF